MFQRSVVCYTAIWLHDGLGFAGHRLLKLQASTVTLSYQVQLVHVSFI